MLATKSGTWNTSSVDTVGEVGSFSSIALDNSGFLHISYKDGTNGNLKYTHREVIWTFEIVDSIGDVGWFTSLVLDGNGNSHISYYDATNGDLKYAIKNGGIWNTQVVDSVGNVGMYTSIEVDLNGIPNISYYDLTNEDLKYAYLDPGLGWVLQTVDSTGNVGLWTSISLNQGRHPCIAYYSEDSGLKYACSASVGVEEKINPPTTDQKVRLFHSSSNPFTNSTAISFGLPVSAPVTLRIYDMTGRIVRVLVEGEKEEGFNSVVWDGRDERGEPVGAGVYFYKLDTTQFQATRKMTYIR